MTLQELLNAKDKAIETVEAAAKAAAEAQAALESAQSDLSEAEKTFSEAKEIEEAMHEALHDLLVERGHHYLTADDGTVTIYQDSDDPPGWCSYQPIPGTVAARKSKAKV